MYMKTAVVPTLTPLLHFIPKVIDTLWKSSRIWLHF